MQCKFCSPLLVVRVLEVAVVRSALAGQLSGVSSPDSVAIPLATGHTKDVVGVDAVVEGVVGGGAEGASD